MAKRKAASSNVKKAPRKTAKAKSSKRPVKNMLEEAVAAGKTAWKNMAARRARRQAAVVNFVAGGTTAAKKMNARAARKTAAAKKAK